MERVVTKIEVGKRNKSRVNVFLDDEFAFACSADLVYYYTLSKGKRIDEKFLKEIVEEDNYIKGKSYGLKLLEKGYKTEKEIYDKLISKEYNEPAISRILDFLKEYNFVNDERYCNLFVKEKLHSYGKNKIKYLLAKKGINKEIIEYTINDIDEDIEKRVAYKLAEKKYNSLVLSEKNYKKLYKKIGDYLLNKGYNYNIVSGILNDVIKIEDLSSENNIGGDLEEVAKKRYRVIFKSEKDPIKIYRKLSGYLMRRGYSWDDIKITLRGIIENE